MLPNENELVTYCSAFSTLPGAFLQGMAKSVMENHPHAHLMSDGWQGKWLEMVCRMIRPKNVLEIGTFTGYSALNLLAGMPEEATIDTIELRESDVETASAFFKEAGVAHRINIHLGDAKEIIPKLDKEWDLVFLDADKVGYIDYYELTLPRVKKGGWILADNVLFHGQVLQKEIVGKNAKAIHAFNEHVASDSRTEQVIIPIRDGIMFIQKK
jgi:predicted O-methyltransferase YrrM